MRLVRGFDRGLGLVSIALVFAGYSTVLHAQTTSATVSGSVQDAQAGVLPGVTVTMTSRTQGNTLTAVTDDGGRFVFPIVRPDTYTLQVTLHGLQDGGTDEPGRERERQAVDGSADPGSRLARRRTSPFRRRAP